MEAFVVRWNMFALLTRLDNMRMESIFRIISLFKISLRNVESIAVILNFNLIFNTFSKMYSFLFNKLKLIKNCNSKRLAKVISPKFTKENLRNSSRLKNKRYPYDFWNFYDFRKKVEIKELK
ncbi:hypothetical protein BpHYR1_024748 [Brachionus plicatilis]|uniref:Uncharacterized protein n=1 Tax=Brachionus plicatilis TaxID=10195 RepID=A0A3M7QTR9_BRAPC|nr:hypothetical protein BpHYR1_024748 [Brachionus plicatilis]